MHCWLVYTTATLLCKACMKSNLLNTRKPFGGSVVDLMDCCQILQCEYIIAYSCSVIKYSETWVTCDQLIVSHDLGCLLGQFVCC